MRVFASSVRAVTGCELVEVRRRRGNTWISWPGPGSALPEPEPVTKPIVEPDGSHWRCTTAIAAFSGTPGRLVLSSATRPDAAQLYVIERLGHLLGAALMDAELHERDRRRAHELDQLNNQLPGPLPRFSSARQSRSVHQPHDQGLRRAGAGSRAGWADRPDRRGTRRVRSRDNTGRGCGPGHRPVSHR